MVNTSSLQINVWDVGHGISITMRMPTGDYHWIDLGKSEDFSPSTNLSNQGVDNIDYLIVSHPDQDHLADLPNFLDEFSGPRVLRRNKSLPDQVKFGSSNLEYEKRYKILDRNYDSRVEWENNPTNPNYNGGVEYLILSNDYLENIITGNNTSIVVFIYYNGFLLVCPGDIEPLGWDKLYSSKVTEITNIISKSDLRILIAPHHGRKSGYSENMMDLVMPHCAIISDVWGGSETHQSYYNIPIGISFIENELKKYYSTKRGGKIEITIIDENRYFKQY